MRVDKFLKVSRLIKRRTVAKTAADKALIKINDKIAKPSRNIEVGDILELTFGTSKRTFQVLSLNPKDEMVSLIKEEKRF